MNGYAWVHVRRLIDGCTVASVLVDVSDETSTQEVCRSLTQLFDRQQYAIDDMDLFRYLDERIHAYV